MRDGFSVSVVLPAYNEEENVERVFDDVSSYFKNKFDFEVIIVNDGSTDKTGKILDRLKKNKFLKVVTHKTKKGYSRALLSGFNKAGKDFIFYMDADGQFDVKDFDKALPFLGKYDMVIGYREKRADPFARKIFSSGFNILFKLLTGINVKDVDCGFKIFRSSLINKSDFFSERSIDAELIINAKLNGFKIKEIAVNHFKRRGGKSEASLIGGFVRPTIIFKSISELVKIKKKLDGEKIK